MLNNPSIFSYLKPKAKQNVGLVGKDIAAKQKEVAVCKPSIQTFEPMIEVENKLDPMMEVEIKLKEFDNDIRYGPMLGILYPSIKLIYE